MVNWLQAKALFPPLPCFKHANHPFKLKKYHMNIHVFIQASLRIPYLLFKNSLTTQKPQESSPSVTVSCDLLALCSLQMLNGSRRCSQEWERAENKATLSSGIQPDVWWIVSQCSLPAQPGNSLWRLPVRLCSVAGNMRMQSITHQVVIHQCVGTHSLGNSVLIS